MLILEMLTLLVCIVTFAPSNAASNAFIFTIALTALLLLLIPLILTFISGFKGDKAEHEKKRNTGKAGCRLSPATWSWKPIPFAANSICGCRSCLCWLVCPGAFLLSFLVLYFTKNHQDQLAVLMLRQPFMALAAASIFAVIPLLMYWANCSGTSLVQRVYLSENRLYYTGYSGSMDERVEFAFVLLRLENYSVGKRSIRIQGTFTRKTKDAYGAHQKNAFSKTLRLPRTFSVEQERILLDFLRNAAANHASFDQHVE